MRSIYSGFSVSSAGDIDGDGFDDLIIGAFGADGPGAAPGTRNSAGDSYVLFGSATIGGSINHVTNLGGDGSQTLYGTAAADDMVGGRDNDTLLGNGGADVLIGGHGDDVLSIGDATFRRVNGGTGKDVLAFSGAITLADADFRKVSEVEEHPARQRRDQPDAGRDCRPRHRRARQQPDRHRRHGSTPRGR